MDEWEDERKDGRKEGRNPEHRLLILINRILKLLILYQNQYFTIDFESLFSIAKTHPKINRKNHVSD